MHHEVKARYEGGVLRPLEEVDLPDGATVQLTIRTQAWAEQMERIFQRVRSRTQALKPEEIEAEITRAAEDVRAERLATV